ncbi:DUF6207 family protein [Streptomyces sp. NPDC004227]
MEQVHRAIAKACARLAEQGGRLAPHPYVRRHTVAHAELGGALDDSIMPMELAVWESSRSLRGRLGLPLPVGDPKSQYAHVGRARCAVAPAERTTREPDEPGVRLRFFLDLQQDADT